MHTCQPHTPPFQGSSPSKIYWEREGVNEEIAAALLSIPQGGLDRTPFSPHCRERDGRWETLLVLSLAPHRIAQGRVRLTKRLR